MQEKSRLFLLCLAVLAIKLTLFSYAELYAPQAKFQTDTTSYVVPAQTLAHHRAFGIVNSGGGFLPESFRAPGFSSFLALVHFILHIPLSGVVVINIVLTVFAALCVYQTAVLIDGRLRWVSIVIILFDPVITIFSLMVLTESLFLLLIALFMFFFVLYMKHARRYMLITAGVLLVAATYVRPVAYYLGFMVSVFIFIMLRQRMRRALSHAVIFLVVVYGLLGLWQLRNMHRFKEAFFCLRSEVSWQKVHDDFLENDDEFAARLPVPLRIANTTMRAWLQLMARPGSIKDFRVPRINFLLKLFGYPWVVLWLTGFLIGALRRPFSRYHLFLLLVAVYFMVIPIVNIPWALGPRHRISMMPFVALLAASGWQQIILFARRKPSSR